MKRALFIILDNTLISNINNKMNINLITNWELNIKVVNTIKYYCSKNYHIHIISNQPLINSGILDEKIFLKKLELICKFVEQSLTLPKNTIYYSYSVNPESYSYLPKVGMIYEIALEHELDIKNSLLIGSYGYDHDIAINAGIKNYVDSRELKY